MSDAAHGRYCYVVGQPLNQGVIVHVVGLLTGWRSRVYERELPGLWWHCVAQTRITVKRDGKPVKVERGSTVAIHDDFLRALCTDDAAADEMVEIAGKPPYTRSSNWPR